MNLPSITEVPSMAITLAIALYTIATALVGFLVKAVWDLIRNQGTENSKKVSRLTDEVIRLNVRLDLMSKYTDKIPKLSEDVNAAHKKIRNLESKGEFR